MAAGMKRARVAEEDDCKLFIGKYHKINGVMTQAKLAEGVDLIEQLLGRKYHDRAWGMAALDFTQYVMRGDDKLNSPAERLALIGDKVMDFELCLLWDGGEFSRDSWQKEKDVTLTNKRFSTVLRGHANLIRCVQFPGTANVRLIRLSNHDEGTLAESLVGSAWKDEFEETSSRDCAAKVMRGAMAKLNILPRSDRELFVHQDGRASTATDNRAAKRDPTIAERMFRTPKAAAAAVITIEAHARSESSRSVVAQEATEVLQAMTASNVDTARSSGRLAAAATALSANVSPASLSPATASGSFVSGTSVSQVSRTPLPHFTTNAGKMFVFTAGATSHATSSTRTDDIRARLEAKGNANKIERNTATNHPHTSAKVVITHPSNTPVAGALIESSSKTYSDAPSQDLATSPTTTGSAEKEKADIVTVHEESQNATTLTDTSTKQQSKEHDSGALDGNKENERPPSVIVEGA